MLSVYEKAQSSLCRHAYMIAILKYVKDSGHIIPVVNSCEPVTFINSCIYAHRKDLINNFKEYWK